MDEDLKKKIATFFRQFKHQEYKKGEILIRAEDTPSGVFYLVKGEVKVYAITRNGEELVLNIFKPFAFFPMNWVVNDTINIYFYEAMSDVEVWRAPKNETLVFVKENPEVLYNLLSRVYKGVDGILSRIMYLMSGDAYERLIVELLIYAERFGKGKEHIVLDIPEKELAAQSGMTRETVSREMKILKGRGLIYSQDNKLVIKNLDALSRELN